MVVFGLTGFDSELIPTEKQFFFGKRIKSFQEVFNFIESNLTKVVFPSHQKSLVNLEQWDSNKTIYHKCLKTVISDLGPLKC